MSVIQAKMASATRAWATVNRHVPMIKFRKMVGREHGSNAEQPTAAVSTKLTTPVQKSSQSTHASIIEDWQLSGKYRRKPISQEEIDYINMGGPQ